MAEAGPRRRLTSIFFGGRAADAAASAKLGEITKNVAWTRHQLFPPVVVVNLAWWNRLPKEVRDGISGAMPAFTLEARRINLEAEKQALETLRKQGATVTELSAAPQRAALRGVGRLAKACGCSNTLCRGASLSKAKS